MSGEEADRLRKLEDRIETARKGKQPEPRQTEHYSAAHVGWRMVTELVAGLLIGLGIGYGLDVLIGTLPIFTVLFMFAGFAAGIKVMIQTARELQVAAEADPGHPPDRGPEERKKED